MVLLTKRTILKNIYQYIYICIEREREREREREDVQEYLTSLQKKLCVGPNR